MALFIILRSLVKYNHLFVYLFFDPSRATNMRAILNERKTAMKDIDSMEQTQILGQFRIME
jgi:hypothetical protein